MDRVSLKNLTHRAGDFLSITDNNYKQWVFRYTFLELEKDLGESGDVTTSSVIENPSMQAVGTIICEEDGIVSGIEELKYFLVDSDPRFKPRIGEFHVDFLKKDGDKIFKGETICVISGKVSDILAVERVSLNLLARMSGVTTHSKKIVDIAKSVLVTPTRKTLWGLLDKKAVLIAGGGTHRLNLGDAVLVKDNHLSVLGGSVSKALKNISETKLPNPVRFVEIEVENIDDAVKAAEAFYAFTGNGGIDAPSVIMFDNMNSEDVSKAISIIKDKGFYDTILFEASGGINEQNFDEYVKTGVDIISMGSLTSGSSSLKFKMEVNPLTSD